MEEFTWSDFYEVRLNLSKNTEEAYLRSAIGRYYYAIFGMARLYLTDTMKERRYKSRNNIHKKLIKRLMNSNDKNESSVGEILETLRKRRNWADYDLKKNNYEDFTSLKYLESDAKKSLETINYLIKNPPIYTKLPKNYKY